MDNFFSAVNAWFAMYAFGTAGIVATIAIIVGFIGLWGWYVELNWVRYSISGNRSDRNELIVSLFAPIAVPAILVVAALKAYTARTA